MIRHHIQNAVLYTLSFSDGIRFGELKPDNLENKLFNYHLKQLIRDGLVVKTTDGRYCLSVEGKRLGRSVYESHSTHAKHARSVLILVIRRQTDGAWFLSKRKTHPLKGKVGFLHTTPEIDKDSYTTATHLVEQMGIDASFTILGGGLFRVVEESAVQSFTNITLLYCDDASGGEVASDELAEYFWDANPDFSSDQMILNTPLLADLYLKKQPFFIEKAFLMPQSVR
jgi:DNA-binding HxlR family transcriptional regulator